MNSLVIPVLLIHWLIIIIGAGEYSKCDLICKIIPPDKDKKRWNERKLSQNLINFQDSNECCCCLDKLPVLENQNKEYLKEKEEFLALFGNNYNVDIDTLSISELERFRDQTYLDYAGSGVYQSSQLLSITNHLLTTAYGNAHSRNPSAETTDEKLTEARAIVLDFFNADSKKYSPIFTSGATGALKIVGEDFPWTEKSLFYYSRINHNSVLGIREYVTAKGGEFKALSDVQVEEILEKRAKNYIPKKKTDEEKTYCLFAFPGKDNFAGVLYPLEWISKVQKYGLSDDCEWRVLLDAAAFAATHDLDLSRYSADYVALSIYKMIGYPTGLGVLILNNYDATLWTKVYWGGGSVVAATCDTRWCKKKSNPSMRFEDGTVSFLSIAAIKYGFDRLKEIGMRKIKKHVAALTTYITERLDDIRHPLGTPVVERYGDRSPEGGIIAFNILRPDGGYINFGQVERDAASESIHLRTGCFCNPGGCQDYLRLTAEEIQDASSTRKSCSDPALSNARRTLGAVRISIGYLTTFQDAYTFLNFIKSNYTNTFLLYV